MRFMAFSKASAGIVDRRAPPRERYLAGIATGATRAEWAHPAG
jgi:hypothetical protein